jgi:hypothetical protein
MQTREILERNFKQELSTLLKKYDAELDVSVKMYDFGAAVEGISVYIPHSYDINGELIREETYFELTKWVDWESLNVNQ